MTLHRALQAQFLYNFIYKDVIFLCGLTEFLLISRNHTVKLSLFWAYYTQIRVYSSYKARWMCSSVLL